MLTTTPLAALAATECDRMFADLAPVGLCAETGGYRRFAWTPVDADLRAWFVAEATRRGLTVTVDRGGNQWAWWGGDDADGRPVPNSPLLQLPGVVTGSHLDSVPDGGAYDGPLGVISAFAALDVLRHAGVTPRRPLAITNFSDEEGARFGVACIGSRIITGVIDAARAATLVDADGVTMPDALRAAGFDPDAIARDDATLARMACYVELHVEQGRYLADTPHPVCVGTAIWPHGRWRLDLIGEANHAGTTRLVDRRDPMLPLAAAITTARESAAQHGCVATIGKTRVLPGGVNAVPSSVTAWLDVRGPVEAEVRAVVAEVGRAAGVVPVEESWTPETAFDATLIARAAAALECTDGPLPAVGPGSDVPQIGTGAGHDAGILANAGVPSVMLFVRNPTGASHTPAESATPADCHAGVLALARVLEDLLTSP